VNPCRCRIPVEAALRDAKLDLNDLNEVILVGGSTRIPAVIDLVRMLCQNCCQMAAIQYGSSIHADSEGALAHAGSAAVPDMDLLAAQVSKLAKKEPNVSVNPDEVVALGAAVQAGVLAGEVRRQLPPATSSGIASLH
jgi:molecular chaperone DnaK (HSP70)